MRRMCISIIGILLLVIIAQANDLAPVTWYDTASNAYHVASYWDVQFPNRDQTAIATNVRHQVLLIWPQTTSSAATAKLHVGMHAFLSGVEKLDTANINKLNTIIGDTKVKIIEIKDMNTACNVLKKMALHPPPNPDKMKNEAK